MSMSQPEPGTLLTPTSSQDAAGVGGDAGGAGGGAHTVPPFSYSQPAHAEHMLLGSQYTGTQGSSQVSTP